MKIGIDLDDVLAESLPHYLRAFNRRFGVTIDLAEAPLYPHTDSLARRVPNDQYRSKFLRPRPESRCEGGHESLLGQGVRPVSSHLG